jgi:hypothetical protein
VLFLAYAATVVLFPAAAVWAWRRGGSRALWILTGVAACALVALVLFLASDRGGNRLVGRDGYVQTAARLLQFATLTWLLPLATAAASVAAASPRCPSQLVYPIAVACALIAAAAGVIIAMYTSS